MVEKKNLLAFEKFSQVVSNAFDVNHVIYLERPMCYVRVKKDDKCEDSDV